MTELLYPEESYRIIGACFSIEIKAVHELMDEHRAQVINYLHATGYKLGLLINFGHYPGIQHERIALSR